MNPQESELVLNPDGSVYHLSLKAENIADNVILVGDPGRVETISSFFDSIECKIHNREFVTHTGTYKGKRITALATGIGTDNIDIVVNELDAAVNINPKTRETNATLRSLNLVRLGTCGALQKELEPDSIVITEYSIGLDGVKHFYDIEESDAERLMRISFEGFMELDETINSPYVAKASEKLLGSFQSFGKGGVTLTANGFFGPQGRQVRLPLRNPNLNKIYPKFEHSGLRILNYEMESSALYSLGKALGHSCLCMCVVVANREAMKFSTDYKPAMKNLIEKTLDKLSEI